MIISSKKSRQDSINTAYVVFILIKKLSLQFQENQDIRFQPFAEDQQVQFKYIAGGNERSNVYYFTITKEMEDVEEKIGVNTLDLDKIFKSKAPKLYAKTPSFILKYLKKKIHIDELNEILTIYDDKYGVDFMEAVVGYFDLKLNIKGLENINNNGRYIFVSNHPLGGLDGICLSAIVGKKFDKKIKYLVNDLLYHIKNLQPIFVPVNKYGKQAKDKAKAINDAYASDDQIITFPAGICSRKIGGKITDLEWQKSFIHKAVDSKRDVIPVYFSAHNSNFFYRFANYRKALGIKFNIEMLFLPDEMFKNKHKTFTITFGEPIGWETFDKSKTPQQWTNHVREITYKLNKKV